MNLQTTYVVIDGKRRKVTYREVLAKPMFHTHTGAEISWSIFLPEGLTKVYSRLFRSALEVPGLTDWCRASDSNQRLTKFVVSESDPTVFIGWIDGTHYTPLYQSVEACRQAIPS